MIHLSGGNIEGQEVLERHHSENMPSMSISLLTGHLHSGVPLTPQTQHDQTELIIPFYLVSHSLLDE